jgi:uncharacterized protein YraI
VRFERQLRDLFIFFLIMALASGCASRMGVEDAAGDVAQVPGEHTEESGTSAPSNPAFDQDQVDTPDPTGMDQHGQPEPAGPEQTVQFHSEAICEGIITGEVTVRSYAGSAAEILGMLHGGDPAPIAGWDYGQDGASWVRLDYNGSPGWVPSEAVAFPAACGSLPLPGSIPSISPTPVSTRIISFEVTPTEVDPGDTVTLAWEAYGERATICPSARYTLFAEDDCQEVPLSGTLAFTIPPEVTEDFGSISFMLSVYGDGTSSPEVWEVSANLNCQWMWFFSAEGSPGNCPMEPIHSYAAAQHFERGMMIWLEELGRYTILAEIPQEIGVDGSVYFIVNDPLEIVADTSGEHTPPEGLFAPERGFGLIWRGDVQGIEGYREQLGWAMEPELGYQAAYQCGYPVVSGGRTWVDCYLSGPDGEVFLLDPLGYWHLLSE